MKSPNVDSLRPSGRRIHPTTRRSTENSVLGEVAGDERVVRNTRARRRRDGDLLQVAALRRGRLVPQHFVKRGAVVLDQGILVEGGLADDEVQVGLLVDA